MLSKTIAHNRTNEERRQEKKMKKGRQTRQKRTNMPVFQHILIPTQR